MDTFRLIGHFNPESQNVEFQANQGGRIIIGMSPDNIKIQGIVVLVV